MGLVPRFYFTVHDHWGKAADEEGAELSDIGSALIHAAASARSMMSDSIRRGKLDLKAYIDIEDEGRNVLTRLYFDEAIKFI